MYLHIEQTFLSSRAKFQETLDADEIRWQYRTDLSASKKILSSDPMLSFAYLLTFKYQHEDDCKGMFSRVFLFTLNPLGAGFTNKVLVGKLKPTYRWAPQRQRRSVSSRKQLVGFYGSPGAFHEAHKRVIESSWFYCYFTEIHLYKIPCY